MAMSPKNKKPTGITALALTSGAVTAAFVVLLSSVSVMAQQYEVHTTRSASQILPTSLQRGKHFTVQDRVLAYDFLHHYTVDSDFGSFDVIGDGALGKLVREIAAIAALKKTSTVKAVGEAVEKAAKSPFALAKSLITHPVDTVSGLPKGVTQIVGNVDESVTMEHDPSEDSKLESALMVASWKRDFAAQNGVDVYSSNKVLQKELNRVGWAAAIGGLSVSAASMAGGTAVTVLSNMRLADQVGNALKEEPPARLRIINEKKLKEMGVSDALAERYLDHLAFTPRHDTIIVESLAQIKTARGRDIFVKHILSAQDEVGANFFQQMAETMLGYHTTVSPLVEIMSVDGMVITKAQNGTTMIPFPLDHGVWSQKADRIVKNIEAKRSAAGIEGKIDLWVTGTVSPLAREQYASHGVAVTENVDEKIGFMY